MNKLFIRNEEPGDALAIHALTKAAFKNAPHADGDEHDLVDRLRADGDLALSIVALNMDQAVIGHLAVSPVTISDGTPGWFVGGPLAVIPTSQRTGIGAELVEHGIAAMRDKGAQGIVALGDPEYYTRFGFVVDSALELPGAPAEYFQMLHLAGDKPSGTVTLAPAFDGKQN